MLPFYMKEMQITVRIFLCSSRLFLSVICIIYFLKSLMFRRLAELRVLLTALTAARSQLFHRQEGVCKTIRLSRCHE